MDLMNLRLERLQDAPWNPNRMYDVTLKRLIESMTRFGVVQNLVVRPIGEGDYEVLSGNQRLQVLRKLEYAEAPCVVVEIAEAQVRLLAQALNRIQGEDDLGLKAELVREILESLPKEEVLALLPETAESLQALSSLGQESMADYLQNWQRVQGARLKHLQFQLTPAQLEVVEEALSELLPQAKEAQGESPNTRGTALYLLCLRYLRETTP